ncbi:hypothetical protein ACFWVC_38025 [Streptomyces sp. NPDC058691]|uniref:hypothetical protein n=1 Tax=Streptomyces sp. NPDC058691 TaxID=3346601 RepID=UPI00366993FF
MHVTAETTSNVVSERLLTLDDTTGMPWSPPGVICDRPRTEQDGRLAPRAHAAARITVPVKLLPRWDDGLVPRAPGAGAPHPRG